MSRVVVSGVVEFPPEAREDALVKGKALIEKKGAFTITGPQTSTIPGGSSCLRNGNRARISTHTSKVTGIATCSRISRSTLF